MPTKNYFLTRGGIFLLSLSLVIFFIGFLAVPGTEAQRPLKYYGVDIANPSDLATLSQYHINTATVVMNAFGPQSSWEAFMTEANRYNINIVVWPGGGTSDPCGFPYVGTDISALHSMLDYLGPQERFIGMVNGHEWYHSCVMSLEQMTEIRRKLKDYVMNNFGREIKVWNYTGGPSYFGGQIQGWDGAMDVAITWKHCTCGGAGDSGGGEGTCQSALDMIVQDRATLDSLGWDMEQVYLFQTFEIAGTGYQMPTADEMYDWGCKMLRTNALDGFFWYTWQNPAGYTQVLASRSDLWPTMNRVYNDCVNQDGVPTPTPTSPVSPTPTSGPSPTPIPTAPPKDPDVNDDGQVNGLDMKQLLSAWGLIASTAPEDLDSNGKVNSLDAGRIIANWTGGPPVSPSPTPTSPPGATPTPTLPPVTPPPTGGFIYGARYAGVGSYQELAELGVMHPNSAVYSSNFEAQVDNIITTAQAVRNTYPNFKPSLFMWDQSTGDWSVTCGGISSAGNAFIQYLNNQNYWDDIYAINGLHEPLGAYGCSSVAQMQSVIRQIKEHSGGQAMILEKLYSDTSYTGALPFADGICDYCAVLYHPYMGSFLKSALLSNLERDTNMIKSVPPGTTLNKFVPWLAAIYFPGYLYMPSPSELLDGGSTILNFTSSQGHQVDGLLWYTWDNVNAWTGLNLYNADGQRAGRMEVIRQVGGD